jgi:glycosyltransferase involved in cell wall biosynthesis
MQIAIGSIFCNSASYIRRYAEQIEALRKAAPEHNFRLLLCEGDSTDGTWEDLKSLYGDAVIKRAHGGTIYGSRDYIVRWLQSSWVWEGVRKRVRSSDDIFIYVESDLIWDSDTMLKLIKHLYNHYADLGVDVVCPMCFRAGYHYDTWGLRGKDGVSFEAWPPYHKDLLGPAKYGLYPISSAGSCLVMCGGVARESSFDPADMAIVGFCWNAAYKGYKLFLDPTLKVYHP